MKSLLAPIVILAAIGGVSSTAHAQGSPGIDPEDAVAPVAIVEGAGIKVGEGTVLHPSIGMEAGVVTNVFYTDQGSIASGLIRLLGEIGTGSLPQQRLVGTESPDSNTAPQPINMGDFQYRADLRLQYDYYPSTNDQVREQGGLGAGFLFRGIVNPNRPWQFAIVEDYQRLLRPTNFESSDGINRDINDLKLQLQWAPAGRNLSGVLHYENVIDVFEKDSQQFANRFQNTGGLRVNYQWLPQTRFFADASFGVSTGIGASTKVTSYPLTTVAGVQTLLSPATGLNLRVGYTNGFYETGPSYSAFVFGAQFAWRYAPVGQLGLVYNYIHNDSINANYYRDHQFQLNLEHGFAPFVVLAQGQVTLRQYEGLLVMGSTGNERDDLLGQAMFQVRYNFRDWLAASADYLFMVDSTDFTYMTSGLTINPSYVRHEVLAGIRAAY